MDTPKTLLAAIRYFSDPQICEDYMREMRWAGSPPACPHCGGIEFKDKVDWSYITRAQQYSEKLGLRWV